MRFASRRESGFELNLRVLFFASAREATGVPEQELLGEGTMWSEAEFWAELVAVHPALAPLRSSVRLARNREYLSAGAMIQSGDEVALIPPVSGG